MTNPEGRPEGGRPSSGPERAVERVREVHSAMVGAVVSGEGLDEVAVLAAAAVGGQVAIVVPRAAPVVAGGGELPDPVRRYLAERARGRPAQVPPEVSCELPIGTGGQAVGSILAIGTAEGVDVREILHAAAMATLTELALEQAREEVTVNLRGSFLEELRTRDDLTAAEIVRRAGRLGCDVSSGAVAVYAELSSERPRQLAASLVDEHPGALVQLDVEDGRARLVALLPGDGGPEAAIDAAARVADSLRRHGIVGASSFHADPAELGRAVEEAELVMDVVRRSGSSVGEEVTSATYRLLFRVLASHPDEVTKFYEDTIAPIVRYDEQYGTDLVATLDAYMEHDCSTVATAAAIYTHRHTVAYRLDRVRELTGLDAGTSDGRERLGLGLKAYRIIEPRLPR
jgi:sugar diacid utilization regulator